MHRRGFFLRRDFTLPERAQVLVVDPSKIITRLLKDMMPLGGFPGQVDAAHRAAEALEQAKKKEYDLILLSGRLLGGDGLLEALATIPYGGVTLLHGGLSEEEAADVMMQAHVDGFVLKLRGILPFMEAMGWAQDKSA